MDAGSASHSGSGQSSERWASNKPAVKRDLRSSQSTLLQLLKEGSREPLAGERADYARSEVYWHLELLADELKTTSDRVRIALPETSEDFAEVRQAVTLIFADLVALFGHVPNIVELVDDEVGANTVQIQQLMDLQERLLTAMADYRDVVGGNERRGSRISTIRQEFVTAFRLFQNKIEAIVKGLEDWRG